MQYFPANSGVSPSAWTQFLYGLSTAGFGTQQECASLCTVLDPPCELFYLDDAGGTCYFGNFATTGGDSLLDPSTVNVEFHHLQNNYDAYVAATVTGQFVSYQSVTEWSRHVYRLTPNSAEADCQLSCFLDAPACSFYVHGAGSGNCYLGSPDVTASVHPNPGASGLDDVHWVSGLNRHASVLAAHFADSSAEFSAGFTGFFGFKSLLHTDETIEAADDAEMCASVCLLAANPCGLFVVSGTHCFLGHFSATLPPISISVTLPSLFYYRTNEFGMNFSLSNYPLPIYFVRKQRAT